MGNIFGFFPFIYDKSHKNFKNIYAFNCIYALLLVLIMVYVMYFTVTDLIKWMQESSLMPPLINQIVQAFPMTITILQTCGIFFHIQSFFNIHKKFRKIDKKVIH